MVLFAPPSLNGYRQWVRGIMEVPVAVLPDNSIYLEMSYDISLEIVNRYLDIASPNIYTIAVYNLGGDYLVNITQDNATLPSPQNTYWTNLRNSLQVNSFVPGIIDNAEDQETSAGLELLASMKNLTIADLQQLKTPWGRVYLGIAQSVGSMWGLTS